MKAERRIIIEQLNTALLKYKELAGLSYPAQGWIRTIRKTLGMSTRQLARRASLSQQRLSKIEQQEITGEIKLNTLKKIAQGLDFVFIYAFIPKSSVSEIIRKQAEKIVRKRFERVTASMVLEDQEVYGDAKNKSYELAIEKIIEQMDKTFWDY